MILSKNFIKNVSSFWTNNFDIQILIKNNIKFNDWTFLISDLSFIIFSVITNFQLIKVYLIGTKYVKGNELKWLLSSKFKVLSFISFPKISHCDL